MMEAQLIILAGGKSSRMGTNKSMLRLKEKTVIEAIRDTLSPLVKDIIIVSNQPEVYAFLGLPVVEDNIKDKGPLAGLQAGLEASKHDTNLIVACDMPFISATIAKALLQDSKDVDAVVPVIQEKLHPLFAVYKKSITHEVTTCLENDNLRIRSLLEKLNVRYVDENKLDPHGLIDLKKSFFNMNYPSDYDLAKDVIDEK